MVNMNMCKGFKAETTVFEVFQQKGPAFVLLAVTFSLFPSSISYMTSGIHDHVIGGRMSQHPDLIE
jgi:hypothetical protein